MAARHPGSDSSRVRLAKYFGRLASVYGTGEYYLTRRAAVIAALRPELAQASRVLDLGCGNGAYTADFSRGAGVSWVTGCDLSLEMLVAARRRGLKRASFVQCDVRALPFKARAWPLIFCSHVLPFVADLERSVLEIARCLAVPGLVVTTLGTSSVRRELRKLMSAEQAREFEAKVFSTSMAQSEATLGEPRYRAAFEAAGLFVEARTVRFSVSWAGIEEWIQLRWMTVAGEHERSAAEQTLAELRAAAGRPQTLALQEPLLLSRRR